MTNYNFFDSYISRTRQVQDRNYDLILFRVGKPGSTARNQVIDYYKQKYRPDAFPAGIFYGWESTSTGVISSRWQNTKGHPQKDEWPNEFGRWQGKGAKARWRHGNCLIFQPNRARIYTRQEKLKRVLHLVFTTLRHLLSIIKINYPDQNPHPGVLIQFLMLCTG